jgi:hypothetical protein
LIIELTNRYRSKGRTREMAIFCNAIFWFSIREALYDRKAEIEKIIDKPFPIRKILNNRRPSASDHRFQLIAIFMVNQMAINSGALIRNDVMYRDRSTIPKISDCFLEYSQLKDVSLSFRFCRRYRFDVIWEIKKLLK